MSKLTGWKRIMFFIVVVIVAVRIVYIGLGGEINKEHYASMVYDLSTFTVVPCQNVSVKFIGGNDKLDSLELVFNNVADDKEGAVTLAISKGQKIIYQTNVSLANIVNWEWNKIYVNMCLNEGEEYVISLNSNDACTQIPNVLLTENVADEIIGSYQNDEITNGTVAVNFDYLRSPGYIDRLIVISLWLIFVAAVYLFLLFFEKITGIVKNIYIHVTENVPAGALAAVLEILAVNIIITGSEIRFEEPTKIIMYAISLFAVIKGDEKKRYLGELTNKSYQRVILCLLYVYSAFALTGQRLLIYPLDLKLTAAGIFVFTVTVFWFVPVINTVLYYLERSGSIINHSNTVKKLKTWQFILCCSGFLLVPAFYNLLANNPGISNVDTYYCMIYFAQNLHGMYDWHPAFYCMVLRIIEEISNTTYAVIAVQYFFWGYVINELLLYLRKKGVQESILIGTAAFLGLNAADFLQLNTIWKDIPYTLSLLWVFVILVKLTIDYEIYKGKWYIYLEYIIAMTGVCLYRKNGIVPFIIIAISMVVIFRRSVKVWISTVLTVMLIITIKGPIYNYFDVVDPGTHGIYAGLGLDVLGAYHYGGEFSDDALEMVTKLTTYNNAEYLYHPNWSDVAYDTDIKPVEFIKQYMDTFIRNPVLMTRAVIDREDAVWDIFEGADSVLGGNVTGTQDDGEILWKEYYPKREYISIYTDMQDVTNYIANTQWTSAIEWRCGLFTLLGLTTIVFVVLKRGKGKYWVLLTPIAGQILSLLLSTGWSEFRYFWSINLLNTVWIPTALMIINLNNSDK